MQSQLYNNKEVAKGLQRFVNKHRKVFEQNKVKHQMMQISAKFRFGKGLYANDQYETLMKELKTTRKQYNTTTDIQQRKQISSQEYQLWNTFVQDRFQLLPVEFALTQQMQDQLQEAFEQNLERGQVTLKVDRILNVHKDYTNSFRFQIPVEPRCLVQMIHPYFGYLTNFKPINFEQLLDIYKHKLVASAEKQQGRHLLANEICAFGYWKQFDEDSEGFMQIEDFIEFLKVFRFNLEANKESFKDEFKFALKLHPKEFDWNEEEIVRFNFFRYLFLERNL